MTRRGFTALLVAALALGAFLVWWLLSTERFAASAADSGEDNPAASAIAATGINATAPAAGPRITPAPFVDPSAELPVEMLAHGRLLTVYDKETGKPVPNALVQTFDAYMYPYDGSNILWGSLQFQNCAEMEAARHSRSRRFRTDAHGVTCIPHAPRTLAVWASDETRFGCAVFEPHREVDLALSVGLRHFVDIHVVHEDGSPAPGHAVVMEQDPYSTRWPVWTSDDTGRVRIDNVDLSTLRTQGGQMVFRLKATPESPRVTFDASRPADNILRLVAPASAPLRIQLTGLEVLPASSLPLLRVRIRVEGSGNRPSDGLIVRVKDGVALTPPLPLGRKMNVRIQTLLGELEEGDTVIDGPARRDEVCDVRMPLPGVHVLFKVKLVDAAGSPLRKTPLWVNAAGWGYRVAQAGRVTDEEGVVRGSLRSWAPAADDPPSEEPAELNRLIVARGEAGAHDGLVGECPLPHQLAQGENDLGVVTMTSPTVLVSGLVLDESGSPLAGVTVQATPYRDMKNGTLAPHGQMLTSVSHDDGSFALRSTCTCDWILLACSGELLFPASMFKLPGTTNVEIPVTRGGKLAGRVLLPDSIPAHTMRVRVVSHSAAAHLLDCFGYRNHEKESARASIAWDNVPLFATPGEHGRFQSAVLPPGPATVHIESVNSLSPPFTTVHAVDILPGTVTRDPRLDPVDLSGHALLTVHVKDSDGRALPASRVHCGADLHNDGHPADPSGTVSFLVPRVPQNVVVSAPGCRSLVVNGVSGEQDVRLSSGIAVKLDLGPIPQELALSSLYTLSTFWSARALNDDSLGNHSFSQSQLAFPDPVLRFPHPGVWQIAVAIPSPSINDGLRLIPLREQGVITVPDGDGPHRIQLTIEGDFFGEYPRKK